MEPLEKDLFRDEFPPITLYVDDIRRLSAIFGGVNEDWHLTTASFRIDRPDELAELPESELVRLRFWGWPLGLELSRSRVSLSCSQGKHRGAFDAAETVLRSAGRRSWLLDNSPPFYSLAFIVAIAFVPVAAALKNPGWLTVGGLLFGAPVLALGFGWDVLQSRVPRFRLIPRTRAAEPALPTNFFGRNRKHIMSGVWLLVFTALGWILRALFDRFWP